MSEYIEMNNIVNFFNETYWKEKIWIECKTYYEIYLIDFIAFRP